MNGVRVTVTDALRIPGRGTVLICEAPEKDLGTATLGGRLDVDSHILLIRGIEKRRIGDGMMGIVVGNALMPQDINTPVLATMMPPSQEDTNG